MIRVLFFALALLIPMLLPSVAEAQEAFEPGAYKARLLELNASPPLQNPNYSRADRVLGRSVVDSHSRSLGKTDDLLLGPDGSFYAIVADVTTMGFRQTLTFDYAANGVTQGSDVWMLNMDRKQIEASLPEYLASIPTAAGEGGGPTSLKQIVGADVRDSRGTRVGKVQTVLLDDRKMAAAAFVLMMTGGRSGIAVPYDSSAIRPSARGAGYEVALQPGQESIIRSVAAGK